MLTREDISPANVVPTMRVTTKEVFNPIIYFIWQGEQSHLVHGDMAYSVKCFGKVQSNNVDEVVGRQHVTHSTVWKKATSAAVVDPVGLNAYWSEKQSVGGGCWSAG